MSSEWKTASIDELKAPRNGSIAIGPFGSRMKSDCYVNDGVSVIRGTNLMGGRELSGEFVFITEEKAAELGNSNVLANDLVFPHRGSIGEVGIVPNDGNKYVLSSSLMKLSCDTSKVDPLFIYYFFKSSAGRFELLKNASQVGTPGIGQPLTSLKSIEIQYPQVETQKHIVGILTTLDDRIALLRETNTTLEAIAQALFKSWFVDFDPVRAKQEGREPEGMDAATAALFPDSFEESELGLVPKGWQWSTVDKSFKLTMGQSPPGDTYNSAGDGLPFYQGRTDFGFRFPTQRIFCNAPTRIAELGDTLVSVRAPVGDVNMALEKCCLGRGVAGVRHPDGHHSFVFYTVRNLHTHFEHYDGEGTIFGSINKKDFQGLPVINPALPVLEAFDDVVSPIDNRVQNNERKIQTLATLRDTLLPRLISGQLRLPDAEALVGEV